MIARYQVYFFSFCLFLLTILCLIPVEAIDLPSWEENYWWDFNTEMDFELYGEVPSQLTISETNGRYMVQNIAVRNLHSSPDINRIVYILNRESQGEISGIMELSGGPFPFPVDVNVRVYQALITGEVWIDVDTLNPVAWNYEISGNLEGRFGGEYQEIGHFSLSFVIEFDGLSSWFNFPFESGDQWTDNQLAGVTGNYGLVIDVYGDVNESINFDFNETKSETVLVGDYELINGYESIRIEYEELPELMDLYYSDEARWISKLTQQITTTGQHINLLEWRIDLDDYGTSYATPEPTYTPPIPTSTPHPPTATPTPPAPTGTPPTPTPSPTLPTWIPRTPTPTPQATHTPDHSNEQGIDIYTNQSFFHGGDSFVLSTRVYNAFDGFFAFKYIALDIDGQFWFWPDWTQDINGQFYVVAGQEEKIEIVLEFIWPELDLQIDDIQFWALLTEPGSYRIIGNYGNCQFSAD